MAWSIAATPAGAGAVEAACAGAAGRVRVSVTVDADPPAGGAKIVVGYPNDRVRIPGERDDPEVRARVSAAPGFTILPNDRDGTLVIVVASGTSALGGAAAAIDFDRCEGARDPGDVDFRCTVEQAASETGAAIENATCRVRMSDPAVRRTGTTTTP